MVYTEAVYVPGAAAATLLSNRSSGRREHTRMLSDQFTAGRDVQSVHCCAKQLIIASESANALQFVLLRCPGGAKCRRGSPRRQDSAARLNRSGAFSRLEILHAVQCRLDKTSQRSLGNIAIGYQEKWKSSVSRSVRGTAGLVQVAVREASGLAGLGLPIATCIEA